MNTQNTHTHNYINNTQKYQQMHNIYANNTQHTPKTIHTTKTKLQQHTDNKHKNAIHTQTQTYQTQIPKHT